MKALGSLFVLAITLTAGTVIAVGEKESKVVSNDRLTSGTRDFDMEFINKNPFETIIALRFWQVTVLRPYMNNKKESDAMDLENQIRAIQRAPQDREDLTNPCVVEDGDGFRIPKSDSELMVSKEFERCQKTLNDLVTSVRFWNKKIKSANQPAKPSVDKTKASASDSATPDPIEERIKKLKEDAAPLDADTKKLLDKSIKEKCAPTSNPGCVPFLNNVAQTVKARLAKATGSGVTSQSNTPASTSAASEVQGRERSKGGPPPSMMKPTDSKGKTTVLKMGSKGTSPKK